MTGGFRLCKKLLALRVVKKTCTSSTSCRLATQEAGGRTFGIL